MSQPALYRITIRGRVDQSWFDQHLNAHVCSAVLDSERDVTTATAVFHDQAQIIGALNSLYNLGFPLLFVECLVLMPE